MSARCSSTIAVLLFVLATGSAAAQSISCSSQRIGNQTFTSCSNGYRRTEQGVGDFTYGSDNRGTRSTTQRLGAFEYSSDNRGTSATHQRIGSFEYTSVRSKEGSGQLTWQRIGVFDFRYGTLPGQGRVTGSSQQIGGTLYGTYHVTPPPNRSWP